MPSRRETIRMTEGEVRAYLTEQRRIILITIGPDGLPWPAPMNYGLDEEGRVVMTSFAKSRKVRNLERDPRAALLVESGSEYRELKSVILWCDAEIVREPARVGEIMKRMQAADAMTQSLTPAMQQQIDASVAKRVALRFTPFRTASWDHAKLGGVY